MTCKGYDPKAVKLSKQVKRSAATILDPHLRGKFVKDYVAIIKNQPRSAGSKEGSNE